MPPSRKRRVVITGVGPITAIGSRKDTLWGSIIRKETGIARQKLLVEGETWDDFLMHRLQGFDVNAFGIAQPVLDDISNWKAGAADIDLHYLLAAVKTALDDSALTYDREDNTIGLFLTVEHPGFEPFVQAVFNESFQFFRTKAKDNQQFSAKEAFRHLYSKFAASGYDLQTFMYLFFLTKAFGLHGYSLFTNNACASGLFALESAARQIKFGGSDIAIAVGGDYPGTMFKHLWFKEQRLYAEDGRVKPFARNADGLVLGDGAGAIVLEDLRHAQKRNARIYGEYLGGGFSLEGWKVTLPELNSNSYQSAIKQALAAGAVRPQDIDLVNPHGVGIRITDLYEAKAIADVWRDSAVQPHVSAFKPYIGHTLGGSAILETIILLLAMQNDHIPATLNCAELEDKYAITLVREHLKQPVRTAMKLSCGFAGFNGAAIFRKHG